MTIEGTGSPPPTGHRATIARANTLVDEAGLPAEALSLYDEVIAALGGDPDPEARECVADALFFKAQALLDLGRVEDGVAVTHILVQRFGEADLPLRKTVSHALFVAAFVLRSEHPGHEGRILALCDAAERLFGQETDPWLRQRHLHVLVERSFALQALGRRDEAIALRGDLLRRYGRHPDENLREQARRIAEAMARRLS